MSPARGITFAAALALLAVPGLSAAQDDRSHSLEPGKWALVFRVGPDFQLSTFQGATVGAKLQTSEDAAWRAALDIGAFSDGVDLVSTPPDSVFDSRHYDRSSHELRLSVERQWYLSTGKGVKSYWTLGPRIGWSSEHTSDAFAERDIDFLSLHVGAELGGEWFATRRVSLSAAYSASFGWTGDDRSVERTDGGRETYDIDRWNLLSDGPWLGLQIYF